jgi:sensor histidine kinase YesM
MKEMAKIICGYRAVGENYNSLWDNMSILLSNLLDNAINGCQYSDEPRIDLEITRKKAYVQIIIKNSIPNSVLLQNPDLNTTKLEKSMHGYGIASIREISSKYDGTVNFREENDMFIAEIWLYADPLNLQNMFQK